MLKIHTHRSASCIDVIIDAITYIQSVIQHLQRCIYTLAYTEILSIFLLPVTCFRGRHYKYFFCIPTFRRDNRQALFGKSAHEKRSTSYELTLFDSKLYFFVICKPRPYFSIFFYNQTLLCVFLWLTVEDRKVVSWRRNSHIRKLN